MPLLFVPARDSRHRTACFALYKALLRLAPGVALAKSGTSLAGDRVDPITHMIRRTFRRNRTDISPRLVVSALSNGYKFLHLLHAAQTRGSPEHTTVVDLVQRYTARRREPSPTRPTPPTPRPPRNSLLTRQQHPSFDESDFLSNPTVPRFTYSPGSRPRAREALGGSGVRRVPHVATTSSDHPFLRVGKPQAPGLGAVLRGLQLTRQARQDRAAALEGDLLDSAQLEDEWERLVLQHNRGDDGDGGVRYVDAIRVARLHNRRLMRLDELDKMERAKALNRIVREERALAEHEAAATPKLSSGSASGISAVASSSGPASSPKLGLEPARGKRPPLKGRRGMTR